MIKSQIDALIKKGDYAQAYDLSKEAITASCDDEGLKYFLQHRAVLCLIRSGALEQAQAEYFKYNLNLVTENEDILALGGKLFKDFSEYSNGQKRLRYRRSALKKYAEAFEQSGGYFSGINAATLSMLLKDTVTAHTIARHILASLKAKDTTKDYYLEATRAEAFLLLGELENAKMALSTAICQEPGNFAAYASTLKQFSLILDHQAQDKSWLDDFRPPATMQFSGHLFIDKHLQCDAIKKLQHELSQTLKSENIGFGFGALAAGSDIIIAEKLLENNSELHIVLPVAEDIFIAHSVAPYGDMWCQRYQFCRDKAQSIHVVFDNLDYLNSLAVTQANQAAMGMALLKAQTLETMAKQLVICDPERRDGNNITAIGYAQWKKNISNNQIILDFPSSLCLSPHQKPNTAPRNTYNRTLMATIFVDVQGYTKLKESQLETFITHILTPLADCCDYYSPAANFLNTWGDGLFLAFEDVRAAAELTLKLQELFRSFDLKALNFPDHFSLRIGCHYGIVYVTKDPFLKRDNLFGSDVSLAARIEPVTPPGSIYVSSNFACQLAIMDSANFRCEYIGKMALEKNKPETPLFSLQSNRI